MKKPKQKDGTESAAAIEQPAPAALQSAAAVDVEPAHGQGTDAGAVAPVAPTEPAARAPRSASAIEPVRRGLTAAQHAELRERARRVFDLELRNRALGAATEASLRFRQRCQGELRSMGRDLEHAANMEVRARNSAVHERYVRDLETIEGRAAKLRDDIEHTTRELAEIDAERQKIVAVAAPMRALIDRVCVRFNATRASLGIDLGLDELQRLGPGDIVLGPP